MTLLSFDPLTHLDAAAVAGRMMTEKAAHGRAVRERNAAYRELVRNGKTCHKWVLTKQLQQYRSWGKPDGRVRTVYYITVLPDDMKSPAFTDRAYPDDWGSKGGHGHV